MPQRQQKTKQAALLRLPRTKPSLLLMLPLTRCSLSLQNVRMKCVSWIWLVNVCKQVSALFISNAQRLPHLLQSSQSVLSPTWGSYEVTRFMRRPQCRIAVLIVAGRGGQEVCDILKGAAALLLNQAKSGRLRALLSSVVLSVLTTYLLHLGYA